MSKEIKKAFQELGMRIPTKEEMEQLVERTAKDLEKLINKMESQLNQKPDKKNPK